MDIWMDWVDGWVVGRTDGWVDGWMDEWMDEDVILYYLSRIKFY